MDENIYTPPHQGDYQDTCTACGQGALRLVSVTVTLDRGPLLSPDGFCLWEADNIHTSDEVFQCTSCARTFTLGEVLTQG